MNQRPFREYPAPHTRDWKSAERIQAELELMRRAYAKRNKPPRRPFWCDTTAALFVGITTTAIGAAIFYLA